MKKFLNKISTAFAAAMMVLMFSATPALAQVSDVTATSDYADQSQSRDHNPAEMNTDRTIAIRAVGATIGELSVLGAAEGDETNVYTGGLKESGLDITGTVNLTDDGCENNCGDASASIQMVGFENLQTHASGEARSTGTDGVAFSSTGIANSSIAGLEFDAAITIDRAPKQPKRDPSKPMS